MVSQSLPDDVVSSGFRRIDPAYAEGMKRALADLQE